MISRGLRAALILPFFAVLLYLVVGGLTHASPVVWVTFAILLASNALLLWPRHGPTAMAAVVVVAGAVSLVGLLPTYDPAGFAGLVPMGAVLWGFWLALPFLTIGALTLSDAAPAFLILGFEGSLVDGIVLAGALSAMAGSGAGYSAASILGAYGQQLSGQFQAWAQLLLGSRVPVFPLQSVTSIALTVFAGVALLGVLLPALEPPATLQPAGPPNGASIPRSSAVRIPEGMRVLVARASLPTAPPLRRAPGLISLAVATVATTVTLAVALFLPNWLVFTLGVATVLLTVGAWSASASLWPARRQPKTQVSASAASRSASRYGFPER